MRFLVLTREPSPLRPWPRVPTSTTACCSLCFQGKKSQVTRQRGTNNTPEAPALLPSTFPLRSPSPLPMRISALTLYVGTSCPCSQNPAWICLGPRLRFFLPPTTAIGVQISSEKDPPYSQSKASLNCLLALYKV